MKNDPEVINKRNVCNCFKISYLFRIIIMKVFLLILSLFTVSFSASYVHAGNCDTHSTDKKEKGSGI